MSIILYDFLNVLRIVSLESKLQIDNSTSTT